MMKVRQQPINSDAVNYTAVITPSLYCRYTRYNENIAPKLYFQVVTTLLHLYKSVIVQMKQRGNYLLKFDSEEFVKRREQKNTPKNRNFVADHNIIDRLLTGAGAWP